MNPYRCDAEKPRNRQDTTDDTAILWVWLGSGALLILTDVGQPGPWGPTSSLGMLVTALALGSMWRHYRAKRTRRWTGAPYSKRDTKEI